MKFLVDAQLPPLMAQVLRDKGYEALHLNEIGCLTSSHSEIWRLAIDEGWVLVTKDDDSLNGRARRAQRRSSSGSGGAIFVTSRFWTMSALCGRLSSRN